jgi:uncharacterized coiled-coil DUF342 family protein
VSDNLQEKLAGRIAELELLRDRAVQAYKDKDQEINSATQELSDRIRELRNARGSLALEAGNCQQKIDELKALLNREGGNG